MNSGGKDMRVRRSARPIRRHARRTWPVRTALAAAILVGLASCIGGDAATAPANTRFDLAPSLALIPSPANASALPVNRIRMQAVRASDDVTIASGTFPVSPTAASWQLTLPVPLVSDTATVELYVFLANVSGAGTESIQFSGLIGDVTLAPGEPVTPDVPIVRGILANLFVTSITISPAPGAMIVGETTPLSAVVGRQGDQPQLFWTSLDTAVVTIADGVATAVAPGVATIVASAGAHADTALIPVSTDADTIPPSILSRSPDEGATDVSRFGPITARFSEDLDPATVDASTFALADGQGLPIAGTVTYADSVATFVPGAPLLGSNSYRATLTPGIADLAGNPLPDIFGWGFVTTDAQLSVAGGFSDALLPGPISIGFDDVTGNVFVYDDFTPEIREYSANGQEIGPALLIAGLNSNDLDLDFVTESVNVGGTIVPQNTLIVTDGESNPPTLYAVDKNDGTVLHTYDLPAGELVGLSYHPGRSTFFSIDWVSDIVMEVDPATGAEVSRFPVRPAGSPAWSVFYGDIEVDPATGNLMLVSSDQNVIRVMTPTGEWIRDVDVGALDVSFMSGIAWDAATETAWITSFQGAQIFQIAGLAPELAP